MRINIPTIASIILVVLSISFSSCKSNLEIDTETCQCLELEKCNMLNHHISEFRMFIEKSNANSELSFDQKFLELISQVSQFKKEKSRGVLIGRSKLDGETDELPDFKSFYEDASILSCFQSSSKSSLKDYGELRNELGYISPAIWAQELKNKFESGQISVDDMLMIATFEIYLRNLMRM